MSKPFKAALRLLHSRSMSVFLVTLAVALLMVFAYIRQPRLLSLIDHKIYDTIMSVEGPGPVTDIPIVIDLDEDSLELFGQWPWPRFLLAALLERLFENGVYAMGLDMMLVEQDRTSPKRLQEDLRRFMDLEVSFDGLPADFYDYDRLMAESIRNLPVALGLYLYFDTASEGLDVPPNPVGYVIQRTDQSAPFEDFVPKATAAAFPYEVFRESTPLGLINMSPDDDGVVRRIPMLAAVDGRVYPTLSVRALMLVEKVRTLAIRMNQDGIESIRVGSRVIPVNSDGSFAVPFKGKAKTFPYYSAGDILQGKVPREQLEGRIGFLGTSAPGLLDIRITPLERVYPGVEVHATVLDAILQQHFLLTPAWTPGAQVLGILMASALAALAFGFARPMIYSLVGAAMLGLSSWSSFYFYRQGYVVSPLYVSLTIMLVGVSVLLLRFWQEESQKNVLRSAFSRYVAPEVVARITREQGDLLSGEERELSIMFTDLRGFTGISENLRPEQVVRLLNRYFTPMTALVKSSGGTLDKFIGDALMAFWNAPLPVPDHPRLAVQTALDMQSRLKEINTDLQNEFGVQVRMGIGVHTGKAYVGNMGSEDLLNYTLIGDNVNLTSRLEGLCSQYGVDIVVSGQTRELCAESFAFVQFDRLRVKGKKLPVDVYSVLGWDEWKARQDELAEGQSAYAEYCAGNFNTAANLYQTLARACPERKIYQVYAERCLGLVAEPPKDWNGVWSSASK